MHWVAKQHAKMAKWDGQIEKKRARHQDVVKVEESERDEGKVVDIMTALKKSLARKRKVA